MSVVLKPSAYQAALRSSHHNTITHESDLTRLHDSAAADLAAATIRTGACEAAVLGLWGLNDLDDRGDGGIGGGGVATGHFSDIESEMWIGVVVIEVV